jgi:hypothetical protein
LSTLSLLTCSVTRWRDLWVPCKCSP